jgi:hypothetical protein
MFKLPKLNMLHFDILRLISLQLDPYELSISKELHIMYNDTWYYDKLVLLYPDLNLFTTTNYKDLYKKSLMQGDIFYCTSIGNSYVPINKKGIKASQIANNRLRPYNPSISNNLILTFNGNLWCDDVFLDKNVIDISYDAYIKTKELYLFEDDEWKIKFTDNKKLFRIEYDFYTGVYAIESEDGVFIYRDNSLRYIQFENKVDFVLDYYLYIFDIYNNVFYSDVCNENFDLTQRYDIIFKNGNICNILGKLIMIEQSVNCKQITEQIVVVPFDYSFERVCRFDQYVIILSGDKSYFYEYYDDNQYISVDITLKNIKNIFANGEGRFYIVK